MKKTEWIHASIKPVYCGLYETVWAGAFNWRFWDGKVWLICDSEGVWKPSLLGVPPIGKKELWRGLARPAK
jgi:hypothetical protein